MIYSVQKEQFQIKKGRSSPTSYWPTRSTVLRPRCKRPARSHAGATGDHRRTDIQARRAVPGDGHTESYRTGRHISLPEAQVDRFLLKVIIGYPSKDDERQIIRQNISPRKIEVKPLLRPEEILDAQKIVEQIYLDEKIERYIVDIVFATRRPEDYNLKDLSGIISFGASPRASIGMAKAARSYAFLRQRGYVIPEDVRAVCHDVMRHRIGLSYEAEANNITSDEIISEIPDKVEVP